MVWPLLCSGPAVSLHRERRGFLFSCRDFCYNQAFSKVCFLLLTMNPNCWLLQGHVAKLSLPGLSLIFDADRPAEGLAKLLFSIGLGPAAA